ncbi:MAG: SPOR domain-containing protein [Kordiimonadaceae bacterium]|nr:SPOR domain-containing protein [Kordiimonadaceae bacterium]
MVRYIFVILIMVMCGAGVFAQTSTNESTNETAVEDALTFIRNGEIQRGVVALEALALQGVPEALFHMGEINKLGIGKDQPSIPVATMYYRLASRLGHERASLLLANILFFDGDGSDATFAEAMTAWQSLALAGNAEAIYMLGMVYWNGEAGTKRDPVRGYGLVWLAAEKGYSGAEQNELSMKGMLNSSARKTGVDYAQNLNERGFSAEPLAMDLVLDSVPSAAGTISTPIPEEDKPLVKPEDWTTVWRLEVGFAMDQDKVTLLQKVINGRQSKVVGGLFSEVIDSANRPGLYRLVFGPVKSMHDAVNRCVDLKRAGYDCFARPPEESDDDEDDYEDE